MLLICDTSNLSSNFSFFDFQLMLNLLNKFMKVISVVEEKYLQYI